MSEQNESLVRGAYEAYSRGEIAKLLDIIDPGLEWTYLDPSVADPERTRRMLGITSVPSESAPNLSWHSSPIGQVTPLEGPAGGRVVIRLGVLTSLIAAMLSRYTGEALADARSISQPGTRHCNPSPS